MKASDNTKMARKPLSTLTINAMKPKCKDLSDTGENSGLRISCGATGNKAFYYRYRNPFNKAKTISLTFGHYPLMGLADARKAFQELKSIRKAGRCPKTERDSLVGIEKAQIDEQARQEQVDSFTVTDLIEFYLTQKIEDRIIDGKRVAGARKPKGQAEVRRTLYGDAVKVLGAKPAVSVTRVDVIKMIEAILVRGANVQAGNVLRELSSAYEYAIGFARFDDSFANPALLAKMSLSKTGVKLTSKKGKRALSDDELVKLLSWLPSSGFSTTQKNVMRLTLWTGCRTGEVCDARWKDINLERGVWELSDTKNGTSQTVQLSRQAIAFLTQLKLMTDEYPFPSIRTKKPIQQKSLSEMKWQLKNPDKLSNRRNLKPEQKWLDSIEDWSPHDLRRTVRTGLARLGCPSDVGETVLGHTLEGMKSIYDQHKYHDECRGWLQKWADHLDGLQE